MAQGPLKRSDTFLSTVSASIDLRPCRAADWVIVAEAARLRIISILGWPGRIDWGASVRGSAEPAPEPRLALTAVGTTLTLDEIAALRARLQRAMSGHVGVVRDAAGLTRAREEIKNIAAELRLESAGETRENDPKTRRAFWELRNLVDAAQAVIEAAAHREESHGRTTAPIFQTAIPPSMESTRSGKLMVRFATAP